jgi:hypothetical protein
MISGKINISAPPSHLHKRKCEKVKISAQFLELPHAMREIEMRRFARRISKFRV